MDNRIGYSVSVVQGKLRRCVRSIKFYDPDGHIIEVGETMKMVVKKFLNSGLTMEQTSKRMDVPVEDLPKFLND